MRLLFVEDDSRVADHVVKGLSEAGHVVDHVADGRSGLFQAAGEGYDVIISDRMLPQCGRPDHPAGPCAPRATRRWSWCSARSARWTSG